MSDITTTEIEERNQEYLKGLQDNIGKYFSFLSTGKLKISSTLEIKELR